jgi:hypothetical protein
VALAISCSDSDPGRPIDGSVLTLDVVPANAWLVSGSTLRLEAVARTLRSGYQPSVKWSSTDSRVVSVSTREGASRRTGSATILAEAGGVETATVITVTTAGAPVTWSIEHEE